MGTFVTNPLAAALRRALHAALGLALGLVLAGCINNPPKVAVNEPTTVRPLGVPSNAAQLPGNGAIFQNATYRPVFEDRRARMAGDVLTIQIQEKHSARQKSDSTADRSGKVEGSIGALPFLNSASTIARLKAAGSSTNNFEGKGETGTDNTFTGTITVTVIEVLPNGNMLVGGEKQVGINQSVETLRFSGVVNPATILPGNSVSSTQVADARLEVRSRGDIDRAQTTGWLARFFLSFMPI